MKQETTAALQTIVCSPDDQNARPRAFDLWSDLTDTEAGKLRACFVELTVRAGESFIRCGDAGECLYLVHHGTVEVRRGEQTLAKFGSGHIVGEMALLNREPRNADVVAVTDCQLWRLAADDFEALCQQLPQLKLVLTRLVAHRLNWSGDDVLARHIGDYQVVGELGRGNMGWVFRATRDGKTYALKMLPHLLVQQTGFLETYRNEARLLRLLRHENIVSLYDSIELYGTLFLVLEYVDGLHLHDWREQAGPPSTADMRCIARSVTRALLTAHAQGIIHRDVKPGNVMINAAGVVKLVDFGIATEATGQSPSKNVALTPCYAAPEQFDGKWGAESDFYSLGVMLYELLAGKMPYRAETLIEWAHAHREVQPHPLSRWSHPGDLRKFVRAALIKDPLRRRIELLTFLQSWGSQTDPLAISRPPVI